MKGGRSGSQNPKCRRPPTTPRPRLPRSGRKAPTLSSHGRRVTVVELLTTERGKSRCPSVFYGAVRASGQSQAGTMRRSLLRRCGEHGVSAVQQLRISSNLHRVTRPRRGSSTRRSPRPSSSAVRTKRSAAHHSAARLRALRRVLRVVLFVVRLRRVHTASIVLRDAPTDSPSKRRRATELLGDACASTMSMCAEVHNVLNCSPPEPKRAAPSAPPSAGLRQGFLLG